MKGYAIRLKPTSDLFGWHFHNFSVHPDQSPILFNTPGAAKCCLRAQECTVGNSKGGFDYTGQIYLGKTWYPRSDFEIVEYEVQLTELSTQTCERKK